MATQNKLRTISSDSWHPATDILTGVSVSSFGKKVTGDGTLFHSEVTAGAWLVNTNSGEARRVKYIYTDTELVLEKAFSSDLVGQPVEFISSDAAKMIYLLIINKSGDDIDINFQTLPDGVAFEDGQPNSKGYTYKLATPVFIETEEEVIIQTEWLGNTIGG